MDITASKAGIRINAVTLDLNDAVMIGKIRKDLEAAISGCDTELLTLHSFKKDLEHNIMDRFEKAGRADSINKSVMNLLSLELLKSEHMLKKTIISIYDASIKAIIDDMLEDPPTTLKAINSATPATIAKIVYKESEIIYSKVNSAVKKVLESINETMKAEGIEEVIK